MRGLAGMHRRERAGFPEVERKAGSLLVGVVAPAPLQCLPHLAVEAHAAGGRQLFQQGLLHEGVGEAVAPGGLRLLDHPRGECFLDEAQEVVVAAFAEQRERVVGELASDDRAHLQQCIGLVREMVEPAAQGLAHAFGQGNAGDRFFPK